MAPAVDAEPTSSGVLVLEKRHRVGTKDPHAMNAGAGGSAAPDGRDLQIDDMADKFRNHLVVPIVDPVSGQSRWTALVPTSMVTDEGVSIDTINDGIASRLDWAPGDVVTASVTVRARVGSQGLLLSSRPPAEAGSRTGASVPLDESGSSANVSLVVTPTGTLEVHKTCSHSGVDDNGRPWLERQNRFLETSVAVRETDLFVKPLRHAATEQHFSLDFPYLPSQTLAQLALAGGIGGDLLLRLTCTLLGEMAQRVWPRSTTDAPPDFIHRAHFDRIQRRVAIARAAVPELGAIVDSDEIVVNGRKLAGYHQVMSQLRSHPAMAAMAPTLIGEIHGDLNLHNILCCVGAAAPRPVALIDPRGVHLLSDFAKARDFEPGDYAYELSKLKFSLSAFSEIRRGLLEVRGAGAEFTLRFRHHAGSDAMRRADAGFLDALASDARFAEWVARAEPGGFGALRSRVLLGEAANFIADAACALGRNAAHEVVPLFLIGLDKLNRFLATLGGAVPEPRPDDWFPRAGEGGRTVAAGVLAVQRSLLGAAGATCAARTWDVMECAVARAQVPVARRLLEALRGKCFPVDTAVFVSSSPAAVAKLAFPLVLVHGVDAAQSSTGAALSGVAQADAFFARSGLAAHERAALRIVSLQSGAAPLQPAPTTETATATATAVPGGFARHGSPLLAPGPWGGSPLQLLLLTALQLPFPRRGGRWFADGSSLLVLSRELEVPTGDLCVVTGPAPAPAADDTASCPAEASSATATGQDGGKTAVPVGPVFLSSRATDALTQALRRGIRPLGNLVTDVVLARQLGRDAWAEAYRSWLGGGARDPGAAWEAAQELSAAAGGSGVGSGVEYVYGGDEMAIHRFGTLEEYKALMAKTTGDADLDSLAFLAAALAWSERWRVRAWACFEDAGVCGREEGGKAD